MKKRLIPLVLIGLLIVTVMSGCGLVRLESQLDAVEDAAESRIDYVEDKAEAALHQTQQDKAKVAPSDPPASSDSSASSGQTDLPAAELTVEQAKTIALEHAGYTADQVTGLYAERDMDDGVLYYEVQFRVDRMEYDYDIHAETGKIISFDVDD